MKRDATITIIGIVVILAMCFGLAAVRPPFQPGKTAPFVAVSGGTTPTGPVVMHINGEPITESEFEAAFAQLPDDVKQQFASAPGRQAFAEQYVRMKLLEQEGRKLGVDRDPVVEAQIAADRTNILGRAAADKLVGEPSQQAVQSFYKQNTGQFETIDLSHIVLAFAGSSIKPRNGGGAPSQNEARNHAMELYVQLRSGANFGTLARKFSDDSSSVEQDGHLGQFTRGMLPPEIEARVWQLPPGRFTGPIPSRFGMHIFKVNARSTAPLPQVSATIARHVKQEKTLERVEMLRRSAKVEFDPKYFPDARTGRSNTPGKRPS